MKCRHCQLPITHYWGHLWHDACKIFPQYCPTTEANGGSQLHEPEINPATIPNPERTFHT